MKNIFFICLCAQPFAFTGCVDDDDDSINRWKLVQVVELLPEN